MPMEILTGKFTDRDKAIMAGEEILRKAVKTLAKKSDNVLTDTDAAAVVRNGRMVAEAIIYWCDKAEEDGYLPPGSAGDATHSAADVLTFVAVDGAKRPARRR